jgi:hypothetical protein
MSIVGSRTTGLLMMFADAVHNQKAQLHKRPPSVVCCSIGTPLGRRTPIVRLDSTLHRVYMYSIMGNTKPLGMTSARATKTTWWVQPLRRPCPVCASSTTSTVRERGTSRMRFRLLRRQGSRPPSSTTSNKRAVRPRRVGQNQSFVTS